MQKKKGFTFIEMLVVIAVLGIVLPVLFAIVFSLLKQQVKIYRLAAVKRQGDYMLSIIDTVIKNSAVGVYSDFPPNTRICTTAGSTGTVAGFRDKFDNYFNFSLTGSNKVASVSAFGPGYTNNSVDLISQNINIRNFNMTCNRSSSFGNAVILVSFTAQYATTSTSPEDQASLYYQSRIKLRNDNSSTY